jgi:16S rRNA (cytidine1402-2'-O)-methyltransferase
MSFESGLYVVATPIGNLADMSQRAVAILDAAEIVAVEDSRVTGKLLHHLGLKKKMRRYNDHSSAGDRDSLIAAAREGVVALVSDAGTPLISDPGYKLVRAAREAGVSVYTIPGGDRGAFDLWSADRPLFVFRLFAP